MKEMPKETPEALYDKLTEFQNVVAKLYRHISTGDIYFTRDLAVDCKTNNIRVNYDVHSKVDQTEALFDGITFSRDLNEFLEKFEEVQKVRRVVYEKVC